MRKVPKCRHGRTHTEHRYSEKSRKAGMVFGAMMAINIPKKKLKHLATRPVDSGATSAFTSSNLEKTRY